MSSRPENSPADPKVHGGVPEEPVFLSTVPLQDPTLRTPGSEIPEAIYAAADAESFDLPPVHERLVEDLPQQNRFVVLLIALLLIVAILCTALYLYRTTRRDVDPVPVMPSNSSLSRPGNLFRVAADSTRTNNLPQPRIQRVG